MGRPSAIQHPPLDLGTAQHSTGKAEAEGKDELSLHTFGHAQHLGGKLNQLASNKTLASLEFPYLADIELQTKDSWA